MNMSICNFVHFHSIEWSIWWRHPAHLLVFHSVKNENHVVGPHANYSMLPGHHIVIVHIGCQHKMLDVSLQLCLRRDKRESARVRKRRVISVNCICILMIEFFLFVRFFFFLISKCIIRSRSCHIFCSVLFLPFKGFIVVLNVRKMPLMNFEFSTIRNNLTNGMNANTIIVVTGNFLRVCYHMSSHVMCSNAFCSIEFRQNNVVHDKSQCLAKNLN